MTGLRVSIPSGLRRIAKSVFVAAILIAAKLLLEVTPVGHWAEDTTHELLIKTLPTFTRDGPSVTILDISHLVDSKHGSQTEASPTSRQELHTLLEAIAKQQPLAIGIDVDFSPKATGWVTAEDPEFFEYCTSLPVPVVLGSFRGIREPQAGWLGAPQFAPLAGGLWLPESGSRRLPISFFADHADEPPMPSLGAALAKAAAPALRLDEHPLHAFLEIQSSRPYVAEPSGRPLRLQEVMVDYSFVHQMYREAMLEVSPQEIAKNEAKIRNRVVLLGVVDGGKGDLFPIPGEAKNLKGVFLHAALASSLLAHPLYEFKHSVRIALDIILSLFIILFVFYASNQRRASTTHKQTRPVKTDTPVYDSHHELEAAVIARTVLAVLLAGVAFVVLFRVIWLDFILVTFFLLVHPSVEKRFDQFMGKAKHVEPEKTLP